MSDIHKEDLFFAIRNQDVVLFAGAGVSVYAGYPTGSQLRDMILDKTQPNKRKLIEPFSRLDDMTEELTKVDNSRHFLTQILNTIFSANPKSFRWHRHFAKIPHFKNVITTNYDTLFEKAYGGKANVIIDSNQLATRDPKKTTIFKIHGDLSQPDSLIITRGDYSRFLKDNHEERAYWTTIKEKAINSTVLFLGYSLDDINVNIVFDRIIEELSDFKKPWYFISRDLAEHKVQYLANKGINYVKMSADQFLSELNRNINDNVVEDLHEERISPNDFRAFALNHNIEPEIELKSGRVQLRRLVSTKAPLKQTLNLNITDEGAAALNSYLVGSNFSAFEIPAETILKSDLRYDKIKIPTGKMKNFMIIPVPDTKTSVKVKFSNGLTYDGIKVEVFSKTGCIELRAHLKSSDFTATIISESNDDYKVNFSYRHKKLVDSLTDELNEFALYSQLATGEDFLYQEQGKDEKVSESFEMPGFKELVESGYQLMQSLLKIENKFGVRFPPFDLETVSEQTSNAIEKICDIAEKGYYEVETDAEMPFTLLPDFNFTDAEIEKMVTEEKDLLMTTSEQEIVDILGVKITLGYRSYQIMNSTIVNAQELRDKGRTVKYKSASGKMRFYYSAEPIKFEQKKA